MAANAFIGPGIFEDLQKKIDEDTSIKDVSRKAAVAQHVAY